MKLREKKMSLDQSCNIQCEKKSAGPVMELVWQVPYCVGDNIAPNSATSAGNGEALW